MRTNFSAAASLSALLLLSSCNLFSFMDSPGGDEGILARARACLDLADYECAIEYYNQLSVGYNNIKESELAYVTLAQNGATMGAIVGAFAGSNAGGGLTSLANRLISNAGATLRSNLYTAYERNATITETDTQGMVKFASGIALAAAVLAENAGADGSFSVADVAATPTTCQAQVQAGCGDSSCDSAGNTLDNVSAIALNSTTAAATANLALFDVAINEANAGLSQMSAGGGLGGDASGFTGAFDDSVGSNCYRWQMLQEGVGAASAE